MVERNPIRLVGSRGPWTDQSTGGEARDQAGVRRTRSRGRAADSARRRQGGRCVPRDDHGHAEERRRRSTSPVSASSRPAPRGAQGVNPRNPSEKVHIPAARVPKFSAGSSLKAAVKGGWRQLVARGTLPPRIARGRASGPSRVPRPRCSLPTRRPTLASTRTSPTASPRRSSASGASSSSASTRGSTCCRSSCAATCTSGAATRPRRAPRFCCGIVDAVAPHVVAVKPQLAFFEALGADGHARASRRSASTPAPPGCS